MEEIELKIKFPLDSTRTFAKLQKPVSSRAAEVDSAEKKWKAKENSMKARNHECYLLRSELGSADAAISGGVRVISNFVELVCTDYTSFIRKQPSIYSDSLDDSTMEMQ